MSSNTLQDKLSNDGWTLFKAIYNFDAKKEKMLSFRRNDILLVNSGGNSNRNWLFSYTDNCSFGFVPKNYVIPIDIDPEIFMTFLDNCQTNLLQIPDTELVEEQIRLRKLIEDHFGEPETRQIHSKTKESTEILYDIVESVRMKTDLSHSLSCAAVEVVLEKLSEINVSSSVSCIPQYLKALKMGLETPTKIEDTYDARRLKLLFNELKLCKDDCQQRSWALHDDECVIRNYLNEVISILTKADWNISKYAVINDDLLPVTTVIEFYQMETRWSVRQLLIEVLEIMCRFDSNVIILILNSVLPMEIARDMQSDGGNVLKLISCSKLLKQIFSLGEKMPMSHYDYYGVEWLSFIVEVIENPTTLDEKLIDNLIEFLLSFNLQFNEFTTNIVVETLRNLPSANVLTEKLLLLVNKGDDPISADGPNHSVLKIFVDIFCDKRSAILFHTNDVKVLIDIIITELTRLPIESKNRLSYIKLCSEILQNTDYEMHNHRKDDIRHCLLNILDDPDVCIDERDLVSEFVQQLFQTQN